MLALSAFLPGLTPSPDEYPNALQNAALYASLYVVALGTGGIKPNVSAFGADQFDESDPGDRREKTSFFNWFYFSINLGSLLAVTVIVWVQENVSWAVGFAVPAACMALAVAVFVAGSPRYKHVAPSESPLSRVFKVMWAAHRARRRASAAAHAQLPGLSPVVTTLGAGAGAGASSAGVGSNGVTFAPLPDDDGEADELEEALLPDGGGGDSAGGAGGRLARHGSHAWLDAATLSRCAGGARRFTRRQVEEVKLVLRMLPVFSATILYWTVYMQMGSFFVVQGTRMNRAVALPGGGRFYIPAASLSVVNTLAIVVLIPMYDKMLAPALARAGRPITLLRRIGWGLVVAVVAMGVAAAVEARRLALFSAGHVLRPADAPPDAAGPLSLGGGGGEVVDMSVWWQVPQYLLIGLSEVFTSIGQLEFFYDQAPDVMRSCSMALQLLSVCVGSYLSGAVVLGTQAATAAADPAGRGWLPKDLNLGRLDLFFALMAALMAANAAHFAWVASSYEYKQVEHVKRAAPRPDRRNIPRPPVAGAGRRAAPRAVARAAAAGAGEAASPIVYARSVTFLPQTPALPAPFR